VKVCYGCKEYAKIEQSYLVEYSEVEEALYTPYRQTHCINEVIVLGFHTYLDIKGVGIKLISRE